MESIIDAEVITRQRETVHENFDAQVNRALNSMWRALTEKQQLGYSRDSQAEQKIFIVLTDADKDHTDISQGRKDTYLQSAKLNKISRLTEAFFDLEELSKGYRIFSDYLQKTQKDALLSFVTRATSETSSLVSKLRQERSLSVPHMVKIPAFEGTEWNDDKNRQRCKLVDKEIAGTITQSEQSELEQLQAEMLSYRRKVAPLPIEGLRDLHAKLLRQAGSKSK